MSNRFVVVLKKGDDFFQVLHAKLEKLGITSAFLYGLGGLTRAEVAVFHSDIKEFKSRVVEDEQLEILNITGDVSKGPDGKVIIHCHAVVAGRDFNAVGGHLVSATVGGTVELVIEPLDHQLTRMFDHEAGIHTIVDS